MNERRENSVLFSLKELRRIEDDRVRKEEEEHQARADAERAAKEAIERAAREAEERRRRDAEAEVRRAQSEKEGREREERIRLEEGERRHRVEGEMRLQEERMRLEIQQRAKHSPVKAVVSVAAVLVVIGGAVTWKMYAQHQSDLAAERAKSARIEAEAHKAQAELEGRLVGIQKEMNSKLAMAKNDEERERIRAEAAQAKSMAQQQAQARSRTSKVGKGDKEPTAATAPKIRAPGKHEISNDPLDGLDKL